MVEAGGLSRETRLKRPRQTAAQRAELLSLAASQHGVVSRKQATECGLSPSAIGRRLASSEWERVFPGVYRFVVAPNTSTQQLAAAGLWAGPQGAVSHRSALNVWGLSCSFDLVEVVTTERRDPRTGLHVHQVTRLPSEHLVRHNGIAVTTPERTLLDIASLSPLLPMRSYEYEFAADALLQEALDFFLARGLVSESGLAAFVASEQTRGLPGRRMLARVLLARSNDDAYQSQTQLHAQVRKFLAAENLPPPDEDVRVGDVVLPLSYSDLKLALVTEPDFPLRELSHQGWNHVTISHSEMTTDPERMAFLICHAMASRGGSPPPPKRKYPVRCHELSPKDRGNRFDAVEVWREGVLSLRAWTHRTPPFLPRSTSAFRRRRRRTW